MNILLLSNSAPNYFYFFNALAQCFAQDGHGVVAAVDGSFSRKQNGLDALGYDVHDFSAYLKTHDIDHDILAKYARYNINATLLSDFERDQVYDIWGRALPDAYFEKLLSALLSYFEHLFVRYDIDVVLYENVSNAFSHIAFFVAQEHGAQYCGIMPSRLPQRFVITGDPLNDSATESLFTDIQTQRINVAHETKAWCQEYIENIDTVIPDYIKYNAVNRVSLWERYLKKDHFIKLWSLSKYSFDSRTDAYQIGNPLRTHLHLFWRSVRRRAKTFFLPKLYEPTQMDERFLLYPLHFHPEASTSITAGTYLDEYEVIRNIAFNLPQGIKLYVKDHVSAWGYPSMAFYKAIKRLPNVRLIEPDAPTKTLIRKSLGVITLTSTVGYEALLLNKPVFLFGRTFYGFHRGVVPIENPAQLFETFSSALSNPVSWDKSYTLDFVCAYYLSTLSGYLNLMQKDPQASQTAQALYPSIAAFVYNTHAQNSES